MRYTLTKDEGVTTLQYVVDPALRLTVSHVDNHFNVVSLCLRDRVETEWKLIDEGFVDLMNPTNEEVKMWQMVYPTLCTYLDAIQNSIKLIEKNNEYHKEVF